MTKKILSTLMAFAVVLSTASGSRVEATAASAPAPVSVSSASATTVFSGAKISKEKQRRIKRYVKLAKKYTKISKSGKPVFQAKHALRAGMPKKFAKVYAKRLTQVWKASLRYNQTDTEHRSAGANDTFSCLLSMTGLTVAAIALAMAVVETAGVAAVALVGYGVAATAAVKDCYLS